MRRLELLAPARNTGIGIAAIDCGADAVYIAAPKFGARQAAGNGIDEIAELCSYAHKFGARIFVTLNTILYEDEIQEAFEIALAVQKAGADALIVQDMAFIRLLKESVLGRDGGADRLTIPLHASTQCAIRTPEKARFLERAGFSRLILERELSLKQICEITSAVDCECECFVHGALCVCYSGQCYLSEMIAGRSANRGACIQACRSKYDLEDSEGKTIVRNKALLSLKDYNLIDRIGELAEAGVASFKIEGRLKNASYVKNVVRAYSEALDEFISKPGNERRFCRASFGKASGGFTPDTGKTFNRGYTELFIDGKRGKWAAMDAAKSMGEEIGTVTNLNAGHTTFTIKPLAHLRTPVLSNGDGLSFVGRDNEVSGVRADVCNGLTVRCKRTPELFEGARIFRNFDLAFEKEIEANPCRRLIEVRLSVVRGCLTGEDRIADVQCSQIRQDRLAVMAESEDGRQVIAQIPDGSPTGNPDRMKALFASQLSKTSGHYSMHLADLPENVVLPFLPASAINAIRRDIAGLLDKIPCKAFPLYKSAIHRKDAFSGFMRSETHLSDLDGIKTADYKDNISNSLAEEFYTFSGIRVVETAFELSHRQGAELMRTKYCIKYELGLCPVHQNSKNTGSLFLMNNGRRFKLGFDCKNCEMIVSIP